VLESASALTDNFASVVLTSVLGGGNGLGTNVTVIDGGGATNGPVRFYRVAVR
jgi:hypothetical protein